jgi:hypothetical protein
LLTDLAEEKQRRPATEQIWRIDPTIELLITATNIDAETIYRQDISDI